MQKWLDTLTSNNRKVSWRQMNQSDSSFKWSNYRYNPNKSINRQGCLRIVFFAMCLVALVGVFIVGGLYWSLGRNFVAGLWEQYEPAEPTATVDLSVLLVTSPTPNPTATPLEAWQMTTEALAVATRSAPELIATKPPTPVTPTATFIPRDATSTPIPTPTEKSYGNFGSGELPVLAAPTQEFDPNQYLCNYNGTGQPPPQCRD